MSSSPSWNLSILSWGLITSLSIPTLSKDDCVHIISLAIISIVVVVAEPSEDSHK